MTRAATSARRRALNLTVIAAGLLAAAPAKAADATLRLQGQLVSSSASAVGFASDFGSGPGAYFGVEFHLNDRFGIEAGVAWTELEESESLNVILASAEATASLVVTPVTVALDVHLTPQKRYDVYLAPKIGWAFFDDLEIATRIDFQSFEFPLPGFVPLTIFPGPGGDFVNRFALEDQFVFGLRLGFDVPFGEGSWSFSSSLDYTDMDLEIDLAGIPAASLDPVSIGVGVGYRF